MPGINFQITVKNAERLIEKLTSKETITKPMANGIKRIAMWFDAMVKKSTVVDTGRLRSSETTKVYAEMSVHGTNVQYAAPVEYGTKKMAARHMEGGSKKLGTGMYTYAREKLMEWLGKGEHKIHEEIDAEFDQP